MKRLVYVLVVSVASVVMFSSFAAAFDPNNPKEGIAIIDRLLDSFDNLVNGNVDDLGPMMSFDVVEGDWATDFGDMSLWRNGNRVQGRYAFKGGQLTATVNGNTLSGYWIQNSSKYKCSARQNGSRYWGRFVFEFTEDNFRGRWSYCNNSWANSLWNGHRK